MEYSIALPTDQRITKNLCAQHLADHFQRLADANSSRTNDGEQ